MTARFHTVLVANRGEISARVQRTARALGYRTVAVFSEPDADAPWVRSADLAVALGGSLPSESYLDAGKILDTARRSGAQAIHPGYGFLSENEAFARRCTEAGLVFIGPPPEAIRLMGDKAAAKRRMIEAGVPCVPGAMPQAQDAATLTAEAKKVGFPLLVKAVAGGGGRGMRIVRAPEELAAALESARSEAQAAFGRGDLMLERLVVGARHVEVQIFADERGQTIHLGERECSVQRRHQKIVEESPSPAVTPELRTRLGAAAVAAAKAIGYVGAGTLEFLLAPSGQFFFLEMNTRLQVEHPVTELVTGLDLVEWQLRVAQGEPLPLRQDEIAFEGHAIEARLYAEDPEAGFLPQSGTLHRFRPAHRPGVRVDSGVGEGGSVSPFYDPMIAKVVAHGATREVARRRLAAALEDTVVLGPATNRRFLMELLSSGEFERAAIVTDTLDARGAPARSTPPSWLWALGALAASLPDGPADPWRSSGESSFGLSLRCGEATRALRVRWGGERFAVEHAGEAATGLRLLERDGAVLRCELDGLGFDAHLVRADAALFVHARGLDARFEEVQPSARAAAGKVSGELLAPMAGRVLEVLAAAGDRVESGQALAVVEAMKMQHRVVAPFRALVAAVHIAAGDQVAARKRLVTLEPLKE